jgi:HEAT repeat protein
MSKIEDYRQTLRALDDWEPFLLRESGLPGPRGNLELAHAVAEEGDAALFEHLRSFDAERAPTNSPYEFLAFCGVLGLGKLLAQGQRAALEELRVYASDPRWRVREAVAQALQTYGDADMGGLVGAMKAWSRGSPLEQRAAAAALCEPRLLVEPAQVEQVLGILDRITASLLEIGDRKSAAFQALRKGLAYCWSVAVAAHPEAGKPLMEKWLASDDRDVRWIMKENLKKNRLARMDAAWVARWQQE